MSWVEVADWLGAAPDPIAGHAEGIITHMNADHSEAMVACCRAFTKATDTTTATMTSVDRYGFEMSATTAAGPRPIRPGLFQGSQHSPGGPTGAGGAGPTGARDNALGIVGSE